MNEPLVEISDEEQQVLYDYHGGQMSSLYATASSNGLYRGTVRPVWWNFNGQGVIPATDTQWDWMIVSDLANECFTASKLADKLGNSEDAAVLRAVEDRADQIAEKLYDRLVELGEDV